MEKTDLLDLRKKMKARKPKFIRHDFHKKAGLKEKWRRPKGLHSKLRLNIRGKEKPVAQGYRSPKEIRGLHKSGLIRIRVFNIGELEKIDSKNSCIEIGSTVGKRKKIMIIEKAKEKNLKIIGIDPDKFVKKVQEELDSKKKFKEEKKKKETPKKESKPKKVEEKDKPAEKMEEENKDQEKKEKNKVLTKRER